jgi:hypothetical protein
VSESATRAALLDMLPDAPDTHRRDSLLALLEEQWKRALEWKAIGHQSRERHAKLQLLEVCGDYVRLYGADRAALEDLRAQLDGVTSLLLSWGIRNK